MEIIADFIKYFHLLVVIFILVGHSLLPIKYLKYYIFLIIFIYLDWNDFDGQCILTNLEHYFRNNEWAEKSANQGGPEFIRPLIKKTFNIDLSLHDADKLNYFVFTLCLLIAYVRIFSYIKE
jgi:hypothetical protein